MNITSEQKKAAGIGAVVLLIAGAAFVYFDPLGLDLLGMNGGTTVVKHAAAPVAKPGVAAPAAQPPVAPKAVAAPAQAPAPAAATPAAPAKTAAPVPPAPATPTKAAAPAAPVPAAPSKIAAPVVAAPAATPVVAAPAATPAQAVQTPLKLDTAIKTAKAMPERAKNLDLRHCLELEIDAAIAKCAGE